MSETATTPPVWLTVEFRGFASSGQPLFSINGGQTQFRFTHDDLLEAFRGLLPTEDPALGRPVRIEPSEPVRRSGREQPLAKDPYYDDPGDWVKYADDYLSGEPERLEQHLPEHLRPSRDAG